MMLISLNCKENRNTMNSEKLSIAYMICTSCQKILRKQKEVRAPQPVTTGPTAFIPEKEIVQNNPVDGNTNLLILEEYSTTRHSDNTTRIMGLHPQYLESFLRTQYYILRMDGPLPFEYRHYLAIMAAARHQCSHLVNTHVNEFLQVGGEVEWLNGLEYVPQKLKNINEVNKILAHRPWLITKEHIKNLLKTGENSWSLAELVHAMVLLAHYHALTSFVFGSGINPKIDQDGAPAVSNFCLCNASNENNMEEVTLMYNSPGVSTSDSVSELEVLMERMKKLQEENEEEASQEEMATRFEKEKKESLLVITGAYEEELIPTSYMSRYVDDPSFGYKDFARRGDDHLPTFRAQDYCWEDHGFSLVNRLYSDIGQLLDEKFHVVRNLTYYTMATHEDVDTTMLRRAIWNYVHCMFGIRYDDYDYGEINQLLERSLKVYIKTVTCYPEKTTKCIYDSYWHQFKHSEKIHVNLLLMEARMQAELLYALRAITQYMT
ncbi:sestrin-3-like isoform X3 [Chiloscyllium punctatum]|uniref:sestrin-3-like isoform X3 n=1 Tax=Chiloscyllium punctatum TaxID=137246 RepID=UPI003B640F8F